MPGVRFGFAGAIPGVNARNKNFRVAETARNVDLSDGRLRSVSCPKEVCEFDFDVRSFIKLDCCDCLAWDDCRPIVDACNQCDLVFWLEDCCPYQATKEDFCAGERCPVNLPCPPTPPQITGEREDCGDESCPCGQYALSYVYTYVNKYGQESAPSLPSAQVFGCEPRPRNPQDLVIDCDTLPECVESIRLYRFIQGFKTGDEQQSQVNSAYHMVGEFVVQEGGQCVLSDERRDQRALEPLHTEFDLPPGCGYKGITYTMWRELVLWDDEKIRFSRPGRPTAFSESELDQTVYIGSKILDVIESASDLFVITDHHAFRLYRDANEDGYRWRVQKSAKPLPGLRSGSAACGNGGVYYWSRQGIINLTVSGNFGVGNLTPQVLEVMAPDAWCKIHPGPMAICDGKLYFSGNTETFVLDFGDGIREGSSNGLTSLDFRASYFRMNDDGTVCFSEGNAVYELPKCSSDCDECCEAEYISSPIRIPIPLQLAAIEVVVDQGEWEVSLLKSNKKSHEVVFKKTVTGCEQFHLPPCYTSRDYQLRVTGCGALAEVSMATSMADLRTIADG